MDNIDYFLIFVLSNLCAFSVFFTRKLFKIRCSSWRCCGVEFIQDIEANNPRHETTTTDGHPDGVIRI